eukprot:CAMPEP_0170118336 /NCGR_PEP_ID=MMETSP0020_2-20130122/13645_1 /TAXON_ID=98059 /ORGANISM="Dinobryon sp., Strain UTEXLB2267" /LENGTH=71 /DNA_ID=CAMNT_0010347307 /DNA_START=276 /DNA_END=491 /DNA_ORIENTATION=-
MAAYLVPTSVARKVTIAAGLMDFHWELLSVVQRVESTVLARVWKVVDNWAKNLVDDLEMTMVNIAAEMLAG